jgi:hypothetical protein
MDIKITLAHKTPSALNCFCIIRRFRLLTDVAIWECQLLLRNPFDSPFRNLLVFRNDVLGLEPHTDSAPRVWGFA